MSGFGFSLPQFGDLTSGLTTLSDIGERFNKIREELEQNLDATIFGEDGEADGDGDEPTPRERAAAPEASSGSAVAAAAAPPVQEPAAAEPDETPAETFEGRGWANPPPDAAVNSQDALYTSTPSFPKEGEEELTTLMTTCSPAAKTDAQAAAAGGVGAEDADAGWADDDLDLPLSPGGASAVEAAGEGAESGSGAADEGAESGSGAADEGAESGSGAADEGAEDGPGGSSESSSGSSLEAELEADEEADQEDAAGDEEERAVWVQEATSDAEGERVAVDGALAGAALTPEDAFWADKDVFSSAHPVLPPRVAALSAGVKEVSALQSLEHAESEVSLEASRDEREDASAVELAAMERVVEGLEEGEERDVAAPAAEQNENGDEDDAVPTIDEPWAETTADGSEEAGKGGTLATFPSTSQASLPLSDPVLASDAAEAEAALALDTALEPQGSESAADVEEKQEAEEAADATVEVLSRAVEEAEEDVEKEQGAEGEVESAGAGVHDAQTAQGDPDRGATGGLEEGSAPSATDLAARSSVPDLAASPHAPASPLSATYSLPPEDANVARETVSAMFRAIASRRVREGDDDDDDEAAEAPAKPEAASPGASSSLFLYPAPPGGVASSSSPRSTSSSPRRAADLLHSLPRLSSLRAAGGALLGSPRGSASGDPSPTVAAAAATTVANALSSVLGGSWAKDRAGRSEHREVAAVEQDELHGPPLADKGNEASDAAVTTPSTSPSPPPAAVVSSSASPLHPPAVAPPPSGGKKKNKKRNKKKKQAAEAQAAKAEEEREDPATEASKAAATPNEAEGEEKAAATPGSTPGATPALEAEPEAAEPAGTREPTAEPEPALQPAPEPALQPALQPAPAPEPAAGVSSTEVSAAAGATCSESPSSGNVEAPKETPSSAVPAVLTSPRSLSETADVQAILAARESQLLRMQAEWAALEARCEGLEKELEREKKLGRDREDAEREVATRLAAGERRIFALQKERDALRKAASGSAARDAEIRAKALQVEELRGEGAALSTTVGQLQGTVRRLRSELRDSEAALGAAKARADAAEAARKRSERELERYKEETAQQQADLEASAAAALAEARETARASSDSAARAEASKTAQRARDAEAAAAAARERAAGLEQALEEVRTRLDAAEDEAAAETDALRARLARAEAAAAAVDDAVAAATAPLVRQMASMREEARERVERLATEAREAVERARAATQAQAAAQAAEAAERAERERAVRDAAEIRRSLADIRDALDKSVAHESISRQTIKSLEVRIAALEGQLERERTAAADARAAARVLEAGLGQRLADAERRAKLAEVNGGGSAAASDGASGSGAGDGEASQAGSPPDPARVAAEAAGPPARAGPGYEWVLVKRGGASRALLKNGSDGALVRASSSTSDGDSLSTLRGPLPSGPLRSVHRDRATSSALEAARREVAELEATRERLVEELVAASTSAELGKRAQQEAERLEGRVRELEKTKDAALELLGEKEEALEEARADLRESKIAYREQIELMAQALAQARAQ